MVGLALAPAVAPIASAQESACASDVGEKVTETGAGGPIHPAIADQLNQILGEDACVSFEQGVIDEHLAPAPSPQTGPVLLEQHSVDIDVNPPAGPGADAKDVTSFSPPGGDGCEAFDPLLTVSCESNNPDDPSNEFGVVEFGPPIAELCLYEEGSLTFSNSQPTGLEPESVTLEPITSVGPCQGLPSP